jgi:tetratricopeptide (TPR) repeat protein
MRFATLLTLVFAVSCATANANPVRDCDSDNDELAIKACSELIRKNPKNAKAHYNLGVSYGNLDRWEDAIASYNEAIKIARHPDYFHNRGNAYDHLGELDRAIDDYEASLKIRPGNALSLRLRCWARGRLNRDLKEALTDCDQVVRLEPKESGSFSIRSFVYLRLEKWQDAIKDATTALKLDGSNADALFIRGIAKTRSGDEVGGKSDIEAARTMSSDIADYYAKFGVK